MNKEMNKKVSRPLGVAFITAAICCGSAVVGMAEVVRNPASDAKTPSATAATSAEEVVPKQIISSITEWLKPYQVRRNPFSVAKNGREFRIEGMIAGCCLPFSKYDMVIRLDAERKEAYCFGYLPIRIIDTQRARILEFLFRAECEYGLSHTTFVLLDNGTVGCQSWCPFSYLEKCPKDALAYLIRSVMDRLVACSMDICWVLFDPIPDKASKVLAGGWSRRALKLVSCNGNESLAKKCLGDDWPKTPMKVDDWFRKRFINEDDGSFGIMQDSFQNVMKTGPYNELSYVLVAKGEAVHNICQMPVDIPRDRLLKIADAAMRSNQMRAYGHFGVDFEHGKLWCRYSIPAAAFVKNADPLYRSAAQNLSPHVLAKHSEKFLAILRQE